MTGLIWFVQIVHYPLMADVAKETFSAYEIRHRKLTTYVVALPMLLELFSSFGLLFYTPHVIYIWEAWLGAILTSFIWLSTLTLQLPLHTKLAQGFDAKRHSQLLKTNWLRSILWSIRSVLALVWLSRLLTFNTP